MSEVIRDYPLRAFRICVETTEPDVTGVAYTPMKKEGIPFVGWNQMILSLDTLFDENGYPQAFQEKRSFRKTNEQNISYNAMPEKRVTTALILKHQGARLTVNVSVDMRRNTSWQGSIFSDYGERLETFRSELELMDILSEKLE